MKNSTRIQSKTKVTKWKGAGFLIKMYAQCVSCGVIGNVRASHVTDKRSLTKQIFLFDCQVRQRERPPKFAEFGRQRGKILNIKYEQK